MTPHALRLLCLISSSDPIRFTGKGCMGPGRFTIDLPTEPRCAISLPAVASLRAGSRQEAVDRAAGPWLSGRDLPDLSTGDLLTADINRYWTLGKERHGRSSPHVNGGAEQARPSHHGTSVLTTVSRSKGGHIVGRGRVSPLHREGENALISFGLWRRRAMRNGTIEPHEAVELVPIAMELYRVSKEAMPTLAMIGTVCGAEHGIFSPGVVRNWNEAQRIGRDNVVELYPETDEAA